MASGVRLIVAKLWDVDSIDTLSAVGHSPQDVLNSMTWNCFRSMFPSSNGTPTMRMNSVPEWMWDILTEAVFGKFVMFDIGGFA